MVKVAVTDLAADMATVQVPEPLHAPDQPENRLPEAGVAVSITLAPAANWAEQDEVQEIPAGELLTEPEPVPPKTSESG